MLQRLNEVEFLLAEPLALLLPALALLLFFAAKKDGSRALPFPSLKPFNNISPSLREKLRMPILRSLAVLCLLSMGLAVARPQILVRNDPQSYARNLVLAIDVSKSMGIKDISSGGNEVSRLEGVKEAVRNFILSRPSDRIALVLFGTDVFIKAPLTLHHEALLESLAEIRIGIAGDHTAIGDAIAQALKRAKGLPAGAHTIVLFTDGLNTAGNVDPIKAASIAAKLGVRIYAIGIGASSERGKSFNSSGENSGEFDEYTLKQVAALTGGLYANASSSVEFQRIQAEIDKSEKHWAVAPQKPVLIELFIPLAVFAAVSFLAALVLSESYFRKLP